MAAIVTAEINRLLEASVGKTTYAPTTASQLRLFTVIGTAAAAGTEVTGGSYAPQSITWASATAGGIANSASITFTNMPACTVVAIEIWDSASNRKWFGALTTSRTCAAGDSLTFAVSALALQAS